MGRPRVLLSHALRGRYLLHPFLKHSRAPAVSKVAGLILELLAAEFLARLSLLLLCGSLITSVVPSAAADRGVFARSSCCMLKASAYSARRPETIGAGSSRRPVLCALSPSSRLPSALQHIPLFIVCYIRHRSTLPPLAGSTYSLVTVQFFVMNHKMRILRKHLTQTKMAIPCETLAPKACHHAPSTVKLSVSRSDPHNSYSLRRYTISYRSRAWRYSAPASKRVVSDSAVCDGQQPPPMPSIGRCVGIY